MKNRFPNLRLPSECKALYDQLKPEERPFIEKHLLSAHWLKQLIVQRQETLYKIAEYILKVQEPFFNGNGCTDSYDPERCREALGHNASTISRAVLHKHLAFPGGLFPMQDLFRHKQSPSNKVAKKKSLSGSRKRIKSDPLSDEALAQKLKNSGISCARRTVAKYRRSLNIPSVPFRTQNNRPFG